MAAKSLNRRDSFRDRGCHAVGTAGGPSLDASRTKLRMVALVLLRCQARVTGTDGISVTGRTTTPGHWHTRAKDAGTRATPRFAPTEARSSVTLPISTVEASGDHRCRAGQLN